ncbi:MAG: hypothetical protein ACOZQL_32410 [Myxococcota bacterium]
MASDERDLQEVLRQARATLEQREQDEAVIQRRVSDARQVLELLARHRRRGKVAMLDSAQRGAVRLVVLAFGCVAMISGAFILDGSLGAGAIVASFGVLAFEGVR